MDFAYYKTKYLKYKEKYLLLKSQKGGVLIDGIALPHNEKSITRDIIKKLIDISNETIRNITEVISRQDTVTDIEFEKATKNIELHNLHIKYLTIINNINELTLSNKAIDIELLINKTKVITKIAEISAELGVYDQLKNRFNNWTDECKNGIIYKVPGDGDCQFSAILKSIKLSGLEDIITSELGLSCDSLTIYHLKNIVATYIKNHWENDIFDLSVKYTAAIPDIEDMPGNPRTKERVELYYRGIGNYGDNVSLMILSFILKFRFNIYIKNRDDLKKAMKDNKPKVNNKDIRIKLYHSIKGPTEDEIRGTINLFYTPEAHYDSLLLK